LEGEPTKRFIEALRPLTNEDLESVEMIEKFVLATLGDFVLLSTKVYSPFAVMELFAFSLYASRQASLPD
jgi:hypothetical protein